MLCKKCCVSVRMLSFICLCLILPRIAYTQTDTPEQPKERLSVALVLAGGGAIGFAHIPVLKLLEELDIPVDMIIGTSAGALIGGFYAAGHTAAELEEFIQSIDWEETFVDPPNPVYDSYLDDRLGNPFPLSFGLTRNFDISLGKGLFTGQHVFEMIKTMTAKIPSNISFDSLPIPYRAVAVDLLSGKRQILDSGDIAEAMRASMSIPGIFEPFPVNGRLMIDGGVMDNVPIKAAKDMGYDVIIVVDITPELENNPKNFSKTPLIALMQMIYITQTEKNLEQYTYADVIIQPHLSAVSTFAYLDSKSIMEKGTLAAEEKRGELTRLRDRIYNGNPPEHTERECMYACKTWLIPDSIITDGLFKADIAFVQNEFKKIKGRPITDDELAAFTRSIYDRGNYLMVVPSVYTEGNRTILSVKAIQNESQKNYINLGINYTALVSTESYSSLKLSANLSFSDLTGRGSILSIGSSFVDTLAFQLLYLQPLWQNFYIQLLAEYNSDEETVYRDFNSPITIGYRTQSARGGVTFGMDINRRHRFTLGTELRWINTFNTDLDISPDNGVNKVLDIPVTYTYSTLDNSIFPSRGIGLRIKDTLGIPIAAQNAPAVFNTLSAELRLAVPITPQFSIIMSGIVGTETTETLLSMQTIVPIYAWTLADRRYFPQIVGNMQLGNHKGALEAAIQFQPWKQLTVLGGQVYFMASGSVGNVLESYNTITTKPLEWSASAGAGVRINNNFAVLLRVGAGSGQNYVKPFLSIDIGTFRF